MYVGPRRRGMRFRGPVHWPLRIAAPPLTCRSRVLRPADISGPRTARKKRGPARWPLRSSTGMNGGERDDRAVIRHRFVEPRAVATIL